MAMSLDKIGGRDIEELEYNLSSIRDTYSEILEAQAEVGGIMIYRAKVASGGGRAFDIITGDPDSDTSLQKFSGVIVYNHSCNAYFDEDAQDNSPPVCSSMDAKTGFDTECGECVSCKTCPRNLFGSAKNGRGKACKNMHRLYIMTDASPIPLILSLPPTSLKSFQNYRMASLAARRLKPCEVVTEFSLEPQQSSNGVKYSVVKFKLLGRLTQEQAAVSQYFADQMKAAASKAPDISGDDYNRAGTVKYDTVAE